MFLQHATKQKVQVVLSATSADLFLRSQPRWRLSWWESGQSVLEWSGREVFFKTYKAPERPGDESWQGAVFKKKKKKEKKIRLAFAGVMSSLLFFFATVNLAGLEKTFSNNPPSILLFRKFCFLSDVSDVEFVIQEQKPWPSGSAETFHVWKKKNTLRNSAFSPFCIIFNAHLSEGPAHLCAF